MINKIKRGIQNRNRMDDNMVNIWIVAGTLTLGAVLINSCTRKIKTANIDSQQYDIKKVMNKLPNITNYHLNYNGKSSLNKSNVYVEPEIDWDTWIKGLFEREYDWQTKPSSRVHFYKNGVPYSITDISSKDGIINGYLLEIPSDIVNTDKMINSLYHVKSIRECDGKYIFGYINEKLNTCIFCLGRDSDGNERHGIVTNQMLKDTKDLIDFESKAKQNLSQILKDISHITR